MNFERLAAAADRFAGARSHPLDAGRCPICAAQLGAYFSGPEPLRPGDLAVCSTCTAPLVIDAGTTAHLLTEAEAAALTSDTREALADTIALMAAYQAWRTSKGMSDA